MTPNRTRKESSMLEEVRRWRREVYAADHGVDLHERRRRDAELIRRFGLTGRAEDKARDRQY